MEPRKASIDTCSDVSPKAFFPFFVSVFFASQAKQNLPVPLTYPLPPLPHALWCANVPEASVWHLPTACAPMRATISRSLNPMRPKMSRMCWMVPPMVPLSASGRRPIRSWQRNGVTQGVRMFHIRQRKTWCTGRACWVVIRDKLPDNLNKRGCYEATKSGEQLKYCTSMSSRAWSQAQRSTEQTCTRCRTPKCRNVERMGECVVISTGTVT